MLPAVFGLAVYQVNIILSRQFASFLPEGAVSALYYSQRLIEFPMGIFAVAIATVSTPNLSSQAAAGDLEGLKATYRYALGLVFFIMLPAMAGLLALSLPLTVVLFQRGKFTHDLAAADRAHPAGLPLRPLGRGRRAPDRAGLLRAPGHPHAGQGRLSRPSSSTPARPSPLTAGWAPWAWRFRWRSPRPPTSSCCCGCCAVGWAGSPCGRSPPRWRARPWPRPWLAWRPGATARLGHWEGGGGAEPQSGGAAAGRPGGHRRARRGGARAPRPRARRAGGRVPPSARWRPGSIAARRSS